MTLQWRAGNQGVWYNHEAQTWKPLNFLNLYRLGLATLFVGTALLDVGTPTMGYFAPTLFLIASSAYLVFSLIASISIKRKWPDFNIQAYVHIAVDLLILTLLMHASGGSKSGIGMLLIMPVASGCIFARRHAFVFPATATLLILAEQFLAHYQGMIASGFAHAGMLALTLFAVSFVTQVLVNRIRTSEALAAQRGVDLANLAQLNEQIVQQMRSGVLVVDKRQRVHLINQAAWYLLGMPTLSTKPFLKEVCEPLSLCLERWHADPNEKLEPFRAKATYPLVDARFTPLGDIEEKDTLIFLDDSSALAQQAQQMKLASLGRLTASIAHEIRNPLAAISHAAQLLAESPTLANDDARLSQIVYDHCERVNTIIENILQLSRKDRSLPVDTYLYEWLERFREEFCLHNNIDEHNISIEISPSDTLIKVDQAQLHQVLWNLCQNGYRASQAFQGSPKLVLRGGRSPDVAGPFLEIIDHGPGLSPEVAEHIFEPFYTTEPGGTGLGLYIARELCECNRAHIDYLAIPEGGCCFRISFSDPQRQVA